MYPHLQYKSLGGVVTPADRREKPALEKPYVTT